MGAVKILCALMAAGLVAAPLAGRAGDCNETVLREIAEMPLGGHYGTSRVATMRW